MIPRVAVFCPGFFLPYSQTFIYDELRAHTRYEADAFAIGRQNRGRFAFPRVHVPHTRRDLLRYLATSRSTFFDQVFQARRPQVVHAHFGTGAVYAHPYATRHGLPLVVTFHGYDVAVLMQRWWARPHRWRYGTMSRAIFRDAAALLCTSEEMCELVGALSGCYDTVRLFRLGVDVDRYHRLPEAREIPRVTMIGRFVEKKGHRFGIEAFARTIRSAQPATLSIVGSGPLESHYRSLIKRLGIQSSVRFHGALDNQKVADLLARTDVLLAPSCVAANGDRESGLMVVREAGAASVPVIATRHGGIPESIDDGETGYLVPERDIDALTERLRHLLSSPRLREQMGHAARRKISNEFRLQTRVAELAGIYDDLVGA